MPNAFALFTSDPNLLDCELARLSAQVQLSYGEHDNAIGAGAYAEDEVLLRRFAPPVAPRTLPELTSRGPSGVLLYTATRLPLGQSLEAETQPLRYHRWLFSQLGTVDAFAEVRPRLMEEIPDYLQRQFPPDREGAAGFALFLRELRDTGQTDDPALDARKAAGKLAATAARLIGLSEAVGSARAPRLDLFATNQRMLLVARVGGPALHYTVLEGSRECSRCGLDAQTRDLDPRLTPHLRRRTVAVASHLASSTGWAELEDRTVLVVDGRLQVHTVRIEPASPVL